MLLTLYSEELKSNQRVYLEEGRDLFPLRSESKSICTVSTIMEGELNTGNMDCEMEEEICMFPTDIAEAVNNAVLNLVPEKSRKLYDGFYQKFKEWLVFNLFLLFYFCNKPVVIGSNSIVLHAHRQMQNAVVYLSCGR